ncbi:MULTISPECIES: enoyl-CoA hydratase/isomerase family protein [unclassified Cryobacterium]|uniref:enoyl-CoA hydratase/isomerase family protein n=1 Tax=unclassified Cryobacterium TaxID=2649013 RepID=UPI00106CCC2A|nr:MULTISPECIES: enoyl-CoA hydratase/isomerase family protein [unclassified Cryobacterium]TFD04197.1 enoyl-CoA hydratase/isomerase family protein [Cryobacterium sp. TMT1-66-1]TFD10587.1 enoyl-CoA hydratase/isomerase family protein [Cryobacterium sp. TMT1-2-2]
MPRTDSITTTSDDSTRAASATGAGASAVSANEVLLQRDGPLARIVLNRPKALNALTHGMIRTIAAALTDWADDPAVQTVLLTGSGDRALCAGGDIVSIYRDARTDPDENARFWADEYTLNAQIKRYPKPFVALMDRIVLGGGVGLSGHASHRVVTERTKLGMPETTIGFVPDVGGTYLYSRTPGELGTHLALTAATMTGADAIALGLADSFVESTQLESLADALKRMPAAAAIAEHASTVPPAPLLAERAWIDECYAGNDVATIIDRLQASSVTAADDAAAAILAKSPTALRVTLESLRRARDLRTLEEVLEQEYRVSLRMVAGHDVIEGIRAQVIDKDRNPAWQPSTLSDVSDADMQAYFAQLGERELRLPRSKTHETRQTTEREATA